ncbi:MAG: PAS domain S-box protein [Spirochaetales bacterium]|nr:PAS domain S-box protein [Spirochaetales bacterium]
MLIISLVTLSIVLWKIEESKEFANLYTNAKLQAGSLAIDIGTQYEGISSALNRLASQGFPSGIQTMDIWMDDAYFFIDTFVGINSIVLLDEKAVIKKIIPANNFNEYLNRPVNEFEPLTTQIELFLSIYQGNVLKGFVLGRINLESFLRLSLKNLESDYMYKIENTGNPVIISTNWASFNDDYLVSHNINLKDSASLKFYLSPSMVYYNSVKSKALLTLLLNLLLSIITVIAVYFAQNFNSLFRLNESRFRNLLRDLNLTAVILDTEGKILFCNDYLLKVLGREQENLIGTDWFDLFLPEKHEREKIDYIQEMFNGKIPEHSEKIILTSKGEQRLLNLNNTILKNTKGMGWGVVSIGDDITDKRKDEEELYLQSVALNAAANAIVITERNGDVKWINTAFSDLTGYSAGDVAGKNLSSLCKSGKQDQTFYRELWDSILSGNVWRGELINQRKDGSLYSEEETITPLINVEGEIIQFIAIKQDISERKILEKENRKLADQFYQAQKMESLGQLAGGIAHDFNNLLVPIMGYAEIGLGEVSTEDVLYKNFETIFNASVSASILTRQILAFSRMQVLELMAIDLNSLINNFKDMLHHLIREDITLETDLEPNLGIVKADKGQIEQVILNLAINARDAMPNGGRLIIKTSNMILDESYIDSSLNNKSGRHVMITVSDNGLGMDKDLQQKIFEPFFTTKPKEKGTGLGLSTVFGIIKQHNGFISVYSEPKTGTSFKIFLPVTEESAFPSEVSIIKEPSIQGGATVLVVEDDKNVLTLISKVLNDKGYTVISSGDPLEALEMASSFQGKIDLLISDVIMPNHNGPEFYENLKQVDENIKVLFISGYTDIMKSSLGNLQKGQAFLQKPFTIHNFLLKVRELL